MKQKTFAKIAGLVLSAALLFSAVGCGGKGKTQDKDWETLGYQWADTQKPIVKEKGLVEYEILAQKNSLTPDYNTLKVFQDLYDKTNVDIHWKNITESAYAERKTLILSDKDNWPDAIYHAGFTNAEVARYSRRGTILPISDYLEYMPNFSAILERRPDIRAAITSFDGKIYSLPRIDEMGLTANPNLLFLNKNWLNALIDSGDISFLTHADVADGLQLNLQQMSEILTLFKDKDMNGNGKDDEIPLSFVFNHWQGNQTDLYGAFGVPDNPDHLTIINDKVVCTATDKKFQSATNFLADWVKREIVPKSVFENSQDAFLASGKGIEKLGAFYWWESETVVSDPANYILLNPLKGMNGEQVLGVSNYPEISTGGVVLMSTCPNPEVLLTYFDRHFDPVESAQLNYGPIGVVYEEERDANGKLVQKPTPEGMTADEFRLQNAPMGIMCLTEYEWDNYVNMEPRAQLRLERLEKYANPYNPDNVQRIPTLSYSLEEINVLAQYETNVRSYIMQNLMKWLLNGGVNDADFAAFGTKLNEIGLQKVLECYQSAFGRYLENQS